MPHDDDALILALLPILFGDPLPPLMWLRPRRRVRLRRRYPQLKAPSAPIPRRFHAEAQATR